MTLFMSPVSLGFLALVVTTASRAPQDITIRRDAWGVPHIIATTSSEAVFGFGYAQAEDNLAQIEASYLRAIGRLAEVDGEAAIASDRLNRLLQIPALAQAEYRRLDPEMRGIVDAFVAGLNHYLARSGKRLKTLDRFEPWYPLALIRYLYFQTGFAADAMRQGRVLAMTELEAMRVENQGSNGWVIGPSRTANGSTLLLINPHLPRFGPGQVYEGHLVSQDGWNFTGYTRFGLPFPYVGHNTRLGWVSTDNAADQADLYLERFDEPAAPLSYRYADGHRLATEWTDTIHVLKGNRLEARVARFRRTHHGPIVGSRDGVPVALRMARLADDGWLREWFDMTRATDLASFRRAMQPMRMLFGNAMYADRVGNTFYIYNGAIPRRDPSLDWTQPVEGSVVATEWQGFHEFGSLPSLHNPVSGWMQNCNGTPFMLSDRGNPQRSDYPPYMARESDNTRSARSRDLLSATRRWTFEHLTRAAFDTRVRVADSLLPVWLPQVDTAGNAPRAAASRLLLRWDHRADATSRGMTLFDAWRSAVRQGQTVPNALDSALARLNRNFATTAVEWGTALRVVRGDRVVPGSGAPSDYGAVFTSWGRPADSGRSVIDGGTSYLSVVEFSKRGVRGVALHALGASADARSPHFIDQARLMARQTFRPTWLSRNDVLAHTRVTARLRWRHPGE